MIKVIQEKGDIETFKNEIVSITSQILTNRVQGIYFGHTNNPIFFAGQFSFNSFVEGLVSLIPMTDGKLDLASVLDNGINADLRLVLNDKDEKGNNDRGSACGLLAFRLCRDALGRG